MIGVDYSFARPGGAAIKAAGYKFVCRYLASSVGKAITSAEVTDLHKNNLAIVLVFEDNANQALNGQSQGVTDAKEALSQANALGFPSNRPIYFAVDFDASGSQLNTIDAYLKGAASAIGGARVGVYGGYNVVTHCSQSGSAKWFWQTLAWSNGQQFSGNHIYQNGQSAFSGGADVDESKQSDFGQWPEGDNMPITEDQLYELIRGVAQREPTQAEVSNTAYLNDPGLALDTFWNNGGKAVYYTTHNPDGSPKPIPVPSATQLKAGLYQVE